jgi:hypothetical protein
MISTESSWPTKVVAMPSTSAACLGTREREREREREAREKGESRREVGEKDRRDKDDVKKIWTERVHRKLKFWSGPRSHPHVKTYAPRAALWLRNLINYVPRGFSLAE